MAERKRTTRAGTRQPDTLPVDWDEREPYDLDEVVDGEAVAPTADTGLASARGPRELVKEDPFLQWTLMMQEREEKAGVNTEAREERLFKLLAAMNTRTVESCD